ncbi:MAG: nucleotidyltransferase family protein [Myxococcota bacterium]|nr:nucleotidyltransferase family protein [Myxococcota bacterium]
MKAYLLAAGFATRMYPLTRDRAKPLLEVGGAPILSHILRRVEVIPDLSEVVVVGNHRFADALMDWSHSVSCSVPIRVLDDGASEVEERLGALGDLAFALEQVPNEGEDLLVVAGDNLLDFDLDSYHRDFKAEGSSLLITRRVHLDGGPSPYNEVNLDKTGRVVGFREKPPDPGSSLSAMAVYFLTAENAGLLEEYLAAGGNSDAPGHFIAWLVSVRRVVARPLSGRWFDIGSLEALQAAREGFAS